ncbi:FixH family protein [Roseicella aerolata]|uniref:FixH family protein n=1 Tax=Roseicella aerolata TaxID=2883479 RepID=A0A9X1IIR6_9PROT|nr:FixH family protein [Roseicella aerolata]MCB4824911.1 FixH family protein [Roseicella aerolata]
MAEGPNPPPVPTMEESNGVYRVHAALPMAGDWTLTLAARVPGETEPVRGQLNIRVR